MAKLVFGLNQSLDGYVDHQEFAPGPAFRLRSTSFGGQVAPPILPSSHGTRKSQGICRKRLRRLP
jgi:hypothetical protein